MLGDGGSGGGGDEGGGGGDVEGSAEIPAGATGIDQLLALVSGEWDGDEVSAKRINEAGQFVFRFTTGGQGTEEGGETSIRKKGWMLEDGVEQETCGFAVQRLMLLDHLFQRGEEEDFWIWHGELKGSTMQTMSR